MYKRNAQRENNSQSGMKKVCPVLCVTENQQVENQCAVEPNSFFLSDCFLQVPFSFTLFRCGKRCKGRILLLFLFPYLSFFFRTLHEARPQKDRKCRKEECNNILSSCIKIEGKTCNKRHNPLFISEYCVITKQAKPEKQDKAQ